MKDSKKSISTETELMQVIFKNHAIKYQFYSRPVRFLAVRKTCEHYCFASVSSPFKMIQMDLYALTD